MLACLRAVGVDSCNSSSCAISSTMNGTWYGGRWLQDAQESLRGIICDEYVFFVGPPQTLTRLQYDILPTVVVRVLRGGVSGVSLQGPTFCHFCTHILGVAFVCVCSCGECPHLVFKGVA